MPGTLVHDSSGPVLKASATVTATANGSWVQTEFPKYVRARLQVTGTVTGTTPTLDVEIQSADDNAGTNTVSHGKFTQSTATGVNKYLLCDINKPYVRCVLTAGGTTPSFGGTQVTLEEPRYLRTISDSA